MKPQDQALLMLLAVALITGVSVFRFRRRRGSSRAIGIFAAGVAAGATVSVAILLFYDLFFTQRASIGLERIVGPIVTMFASLVGSAILGGVVYVIESRRPALASQPMSLDAEALVQAAAKRNSRRRQGTATGRDAVHDWCAFARRAAEGG